MWYYMEKVGIVELLIIGNSILIELMLAFWISPMLIFWVLLSNFKISLDH